MRRNESNQSYLASLLARLKKRLRPVDIATEAEAAEAGESIGAGVEEDFEPAITDLVSGRRLRLRRVPVSRRVVRLTAALLILCGLVAAIVVPSLLPKQRLPQLDLHVLFRSSHLRNLALPAWADDSHNQEIYSGSGQPEYYGVFCPPQLVQRATVCGDQHLSFVDGQGNLYTWSQSSGKLTREIALGSSLVNGSVLNWSWLYPGRYILAHIREPGGHDSYTIWNALNGRQLFSGHTPLVSLASDGIWVAAYAGQQGIQITDGTNSKGVTYALPSPRFAHLVALSWSPDTTELATAYADGSVQIWRPFAGTLLRTLPAASLSQQVSNLQLYWAPYGPRLAVMSVAGGVSQPINIWDTLYGHLLLSYHGHTTKPTRLEWQDDGQEILSSSSRETLLWDSTSGRTIARMDTGQLSALPGYYSSPLLASKSLLALPSGPSMQVLDGRTGRPVQTLLNENGNVAFLAVAWNPEETTYPAALDQGGHLQIWSTQPWRVAAQYQLPCASAFPAELAWSSDGTLLAVDCGQSGLTILRVTES